MNGLKILDSLHELTIMVNRDVIKESPDEIKLPNIVRRWIDNKNNVVFFITSENEFISDTGMIHYDLSYGNSKLLADAGKIKGRYFIPITKETLPDMGIDVDSWNWVEEKSTEVDRMGILSFWLTMPELRKTPEKLQIAINELGIDTSKLLIEFADDTIISYKKLISLIGKEDRTTEEEKQRQKDLAQKNSEIHLAGGLGKRRSVWDGGDKYGDMTKAEYNALSRTSESNFKTFYNKKLLRESPDNVGINNITRNFVDDLKNITFFVMDDGKVVKDEYNSHADLIYDVKGPSAISDDYFRGRYFQELSKDTELQFDQPTFGLMSDEEFEDYWNSNALTEYDKYPILSFWCTIHELFDNMDKFEIIVKDLGVDLKHTLIDFGDDDLYTPEDFKVAMEELSEAEVDEDLKKRKEKAAQTASQMHIAGGLGRRTPSGRKKIADPLEYNYYSRSSESVNVSK